MGKYVFVVYTQPFEGQDADYNKWYDEIHVADVEKLDGVLSARRYRLADMDQPSEGQPPYLALYELELDDVSVFPGQIAKAIEEGRMPLSPAMDRSKTVRAYYEVI
jgi:hypothetical protein